MVNQEDKVRSMLGMEGVNAAETTPQQSASNLSPTTYAQFRPETARETEIQPAQNDIARKDESRTILVAESTAPNEAASLSDPTWTSKANRVVQDTAERLKTGILSNPDVVDTREILKKHIAPDSHELALEDYGIKGAVQNHLPLLTDEARDLGWHRSTMEIPDPLIGGLPNSQLFSLIRRFNKDVFDVKAVPISVARGLDLNEAWSDKHASDKITLHLQRLYLSIIIGLASFGKQAYTIAWAFDLLLPLTLGAIMLLVSSPRARQVMFPSVPLALVNSATGGLQKPQAGQLGTANTLTGAPEKQEGEAVEEEAANFVDNIRHLVGRAIGMHESQQNEGDPLESKLPKPVKKAAKAMKSAGSAPGHASEENYLTQKPMEEILWSKAKPEKIEPVIKSAPHYVGEIVDNWERFSNAITPTPPFSSFSFLRIDAVLLPLFLGSFYVNYYMVYKATGLAIGLGIFGDPILTPSLHWLNRHYPQWLELLEPKNNILRGIPTNNQLTLTLLRIGEVNHAPIPPVPTSKPDDPDYQHVIDVDEIPLDASRSEVIAAVEPSSMDKAHTDDTGDEPKHKKLSKIMRVLKGNTKSVVETKLAVDHVRAKVGSEKAKSHLGVLPKKKNLIYAGPTEYKARFDGKKGWVRLTNDALSFTEDTDTIFSIKFKDITQLKRAAAFASKAGEIATNWSSDKELLGSVEINDAAGKTWRLTAVPERDELFNRLIAVGPQQWKNI